MINLDRVHVIAEVGINHNGDIETAKKLCKAAYDSGADSVKVQVRDLASIYTKEVLADPLKAEHGTQYLLHELKKAHLTFDQIKEIKKYCEEIGVLFFATPFDNKSADFLYDLDCSLFKIGSPDFSNLPLIKKVSSFNKPMILSTGMSSKEEIITVVNYLHDYKADFALLHCNSTYPASFQDINLKFIPELGKIAKKPVGYSGHERGFAATLAAIAVGAKIVERHITFDIDGDGPDHSSSLSPSEFKEMVKSIREIESSLGKEEKVFNQGEQNNRLSLGKSLVFSENFNNGHILTENCLISKTPAKGISPIELENYIGKTLNRDVKEDEYIFPKHIDKNLNDNSHRYEIPRTWGIVGRLNDFEEFLSLRPDLVEIHLTWRDLVNFDATKLKLSQEFYKQDLVVHAPEYFNDELIDFTSPDKNITEMSLDMLGKTFELARALAPKFQGIDQNQGPRVVVHPGGHFKSRPVSTDKTSQYKLLQKNLLSLNSEGLRVLVENMPPYPWYFGGQWHNTVFLDPKEIAQFAQEMKWGVCYDLSHAQLYCNYANIHLKDFSKSIMDHIHYLHISDGKGTTQEGLQLGSGNLDFDHLFHLLHQLDVGFIPEIWQGHLNQGEGFKLALDTIENLLKNKMSGLSCSDNDHNHHHH
ncbi:N-acetylneuraminate synthase family protein [Bacteriovoracaceae bacterium]|nr:N-acetylneuraminate synthase family protein [Bacteriovoracaceae bacterium]